MQKAETDTLFQVGRWTNIVCPLLLVIIAWVSILTAFALHQVSLLNHDFLLQTSHFPWIVALMIFLVCWQVMILAMMLPSVLPLLFLMGGAYQTAIQRWGQQTLFILAYALVWTGFALLAFLGDTGVHWLVLRWWWLYLHPWIIGTTLLAGAGLFQLSPFKQRYLQQCCFPFDLCLPTSYHSMSAMWRQSIRYSVCCLASCWALMLLLFGLGMTQPMWMVVGSCIMLIEKAVPNRSLFSLVIGVAFLLIALAWAVLSSGLLNSL